MPNASRLIAAVSLAVLAFIASGMVMPLMPDGIDFGYFTYINMALGLACGWIIMGSRAGRGVTAAINNGITGTAALVFWALFVQGCYEMFRKAMQNWYDGPFEAIIAVFQIMFDYALIVFVPSVILTLVIGGVISGLATEQASRRWR
ncbi:MAG: TrgA family protein [Pseudomonadota bacterium]